MSEVKRWDHHVRWESMKIAASYMAVRDDGRYVLASDYDALAAENERLRVKLMTISSAEPRYHDIEWAKAHAAENDNRVWLKWKEAIDQHDHLRAELAKARELLSASAGYATKMEPMSAKLLNDIDEWLERNP